MLAHFGEIDIRGYASVSENVIRRQLTFKPGDRFTRREMRESQRKLYGLELFEFANVEPLEEPVLMNEEVPVRVTVAEGKHRKITTGIGYGTEEQARARIRWDHRNVFGGAQQVGVEGKWSSLDRGVRARLSRAVFPVAAPVAQLRRPGVAGCGARVRDQTDRRARPAAPPVEPAELLDRRPDERVPAQHDRSGGAAGLHHSRRSDRARPRPDHRRNRAARCRPSSSTSRATRRTACSNSTSGYLLTGHVEQAGEMAVGQLQLLVGHGRGPSLRDD